VDNNSHVDEWEDFDRFSDFLPLPSDSEEISEDEMENEYAENGGSSDSDSDIDGGADEFKFRNFSPYGL
jgi:hypothetical protein